MLYWNAGCVGLVGWGESCWPEWIWNARGRGAAMRRVATPRKWTRGIFIYWYIVGEKEWRLSLASNYVLAGYSANLGDMAWRAWLRYVPSKFVWWAMFRFANQRPICESKVDLRIKVPDLPPWRGSERRFGSPDDYPLDDGSAIVKILAARHLGRYGKIPDDTVPRYSIEHNTTSFQ